METIKFPHAAFGNPNGEILVFLSGFPDNEFSSFQPYFEQLKDDYFIITMCLPGFENSSKTRRPWGYDFAELITIMHATIKAVSPRDEKVNLIIHDWGSFIGLLYENKYPETVKRLVTIDIGIVNFPKLSQVFYLVFYQWAFAWCYFFSQVLGKSVGNALFYAFLMLLYICPFLGPAPYDKPPRPLSELRVDMCYPYYRFWVNYLTGRQIMPKFPSCPVLFLVRIARHYVLF